MFGDKLNVSVIPTSIEKDAYDNNNLENEGIKDKKKEDSKNLDGNALLRKKRAEATQRYKEALKNPTDPENAKIIAKREQMRLASKLRTARYRERQYFLKHGQQTNSKNDINNQLEEKKKALEQVEREIRKTKYRLEQLENVKSQILHSIINNTKLRTSFTKSIVPDEGLQEQDKSSCEREENIKTLESLLLTDEYNESLSTTSISPLPEPSIDSDRLKAFGRLSSLWSNVATIINEALEKSNVTPKTTQKESVQSSQSTEISPLQSKRRKGNVNIDEITDSYERKKALARLRQQRYRARKAAEALKGESKNNDR
uniref:BZIP domain-containing protein n=1 Tax=Strongyloides venezuelensis TaxID=75913 RepID=A0A0K0EYW0_STRVS